LFKEVIDNLGGLEYIVSGAAALDPDVQKDMVPKLAPSDRLYIIYNLLIIKDLEI